jgi:hypothetical protein
MTSFKKSYAAAGDKVSPDENRNSETDSYNRLFSAKPPLKVNLIQLKVNLIQR